MFYVCKMCGRSIKAEEQPKYCYFDRMSNVENVSDEDAKKMGLFLNSDVHSITTESGRNIEVEFMGDYIYDPYDGKLNDSIFTNGDTLSSFQKGIMQLVCKGA